MIKFIKIASLSVSLLFSSTAFSNIDWKTINHEQDLTASVLASGKDDAILGALRSGKSIAIIQKLLDHGFDINKGDFKNRPPICMASRVYKKDTKMVEFLLDNGADALATDSNGNTALHRISKYNPHIPLVKIFINLGLDPSIKNKFGKSAISISKKNNPNILSYLIRQ